MTNRKVTNSAAGTDSHIPGTPNNLGIIQKHARIRIYPRSNVTAMAGRSRSTLWKYPMETIFIPKKINPEANSGRPLSAILYAGYAGSINIDTICGENTSVRTITTAPKPTAEKRANLNE